MCIRDSRYVAHTRKELGFKGPFERKQVLNRIDFWVLWSGGLFFWLAKNWITKKASLFWGKKRKNRFNPVKWICQTSPKRLASEKNRIESNLSNPIELEEAVHLDMASFTFCSNRSMTRKLLRCRRSVQRRETANACVRTTGRSSRSATSEGPCWHSRLLVLTC